LLLVGLVSIYTGYFGAGSGVLLLAMPLVLVDDDCRRPTPSRTCSSVQAPSPQRRSSCGAAPVAGQPSPRLPWDCSPAVPSACGGLTGRVRARNRARPRVAPGRERAAPGPRHARAPPRAVRSLLRRGRRSRSPARRSRAPPPPTAARLRVAAPSHGIA
jgi:hypothetical protein